MGAGYGIGGVEGSRGVQTIAAPLREKNGVPYLNKIYEMLAILINGAYLRVARRRWEKTRVWFPHGVSQKTLK